MKLFPVFCVSFLIFSCTEKIQEVKGIELDPKGQKVIPIHDLSTDYSLLSQVSFQENGEALFIHLNYFDSDPNYLFINSLNDPEMDLVLQFDGEGPDEVGGVTDFYFHDYDSIFLIDRFRVLTGVIPSNQAKVKINCWNRQKSSSPFRKMTVSYGILRHFSSGFCFIQPQLF